MKIHYPYHVQLFLYLMYLMTIKMYHKATHNCKIDVDYDTQSRSVWLRHFLYCMCMHVNISYLVNLSKADWFYYLIVPYIHSRNDSIQSQRKKKMRNRTELTRRWSKSIQSVGRYRESQYLKELSHFDLCK